MNITVNGRPLPVDSEWQHDSLLHWLREAQGLVGAKYGCGSGVCGACTVLVDGQAQRSCLLTLSELGERQVTTVEGLAVNENGGTRLHPVQQAWLEQRVAQCGYCQAGQIMATVALLRQKPQPTEQDTLDALNGHLCRCGTQHRVRQAVQRASELQR
jgi:isoquinoline 1-oxidoreductase alpha subunit